MRTLKTTLTSLCFLLTLFAVNTFAQDFPYITLEGHTGQINAVSFSPDGETLASGSFDGTIRLWEASTGIHIRTLPGHTHGYQIVSVSFSPDGETLASGSYNTIGLWDVNTGELIHELIGPVIGQFDYSVSFSPDGETLASARSDNTIQLWDVNTGEPIRTLRGHGGNVQSVSFSPDGKTLVSGSTDKTIRLWEASTGRFIRTLEGHRGTVFSISFSPDGETLASGSLDRTIRLWETSTGIHIRTLEGPTDSIFSISFSPDGKTLVSSGNDITIRLWEVNTGKTIHELKGHGGRANSVAFRPDGKTLASGHSDGIIDLWELPTARVSITPAAGVSPAVGDQLAVNISIVGGKGVSAYQLQLEFDETALEYVSATNGDYLPAGAFFIPPVVETNKVTLSATALAGASDGDGRLATVTFEAVESKKSFIDLLDVKLTDSGGGHLHQLAQRTRVEVYFPGDINSDGLVNIQDLVLVAASFGEPVTEANAPADLNGDGQINVIDLVKIAGLLGGGAAAPSAWQLGIEGTPTRADVEQWLSEARQLHLTDVTSHRGILFLEQLLAALTPKETALLANYPNPFNPETWIPYQLAEAADVVLTIYAVDGTVVRTLALGHQPVGIYQDRDRAVYWDGKNAVGESVASGVYFYTLTAGDFSATRKMLIRK